MNTISYAKVAPCFYVLPVLWAERVQKGEVKDALRAPRFSFQITTFTLMMLSQGLVLCFVLWKEGHGVAL